MRCKEEEEKRAWALIDAGYVGHFNVPGGAYDSIQYQNANHSVRVSDVFMKAVENDGGFAPQVRTLKLPLENKNVEVSLKEGARIELALRPAAGQKLPDGLEPIGYFGPRRLLMLSMRRARHKQHGMDYADMRCMQPTSSP